MNITATTSFNSRIADLAVSASNLLDETKIAFTDKFISEEEYTGYVELYRDLYDLICDFSIGETSPNAFLRNLYDITKSYEKLGDTKYSRSMHDLLADIYVDLVKVNLIKPL